MRTMSGSTINAHVVQKKASFAESEIQIAPSAEKAELVKEAK